MVADRLVAIRLARRLVRAAEATMRIKIPEELARYCDGSDEWQLQAATSAAAITQLVDRFPPLQERLLGRGGQLLSHLIVFHNGAVLATPVQSPAPLGEDDELEIMFLASGG